MGEDLECELDADGRFVCFDNVVEREDESVSGSAAVNVLPQGNVRGRDGQGVVTDNGNAHEEGKGGSGSPDWFERFTRKCGGKSHAFVENGKEASVQKGRDCAGLTDGFDRLDHLEGQMVGGVLVMEDSLLEIASKVGKMEYQDESLHSSPQGKCLSGVAAVIGSRNPVEFIAEVEPNILPLVTRKSSDANLFPFLYGGPSFCEGSKTGQLYVDRELEEVAVSCDFETTANHQNSVSQHSMFQSSEGSQVDFPVGYQSSSIMESVTCIEEGPVEGDIRQIQFDIPHLKSTDSSKCFQPTIVASPASSNLPSTLEEYHDAFGSVDENPTNSGFENNSIADAFLQKQDVPFSMLRRTNPKRAATLQTCKSQHKPKKGNQKVKSAKKNKMCGTLMLSNKTKWAAKKKRSGKAVKKGSFIHVQESSSIWGSYNTISALFLQKNARCSSESDLTWTEDGRLMNKQFFSGKIQPCVQKARSKKLRKGKIPSSVDMVKVETQKNHLVSTSFGEQFPSLKRNIISCMPNMNNGFDISNKEINVLAAEDACFLGNNACPENRILLDIVPKHTLLEGLILDSALGGHDQPSSTGSEKIVDKTDIAGPGSSPDSVISHALMEASSATGEGNSSAYQQNIVHSNSPIPADFVLVSEFSASKSAEYGAVQSLARSESKKKMKRNNRPGNRVRAAVKEPLTEEELQGDETGSAQMPQGKSSLEVSLLTRHGNNGFLECNVLDSSVSVNKIQKAAVSEQSMLGNNKPSISDQPQCTKEDNNTRSKFDVHDSDMNETSKRNVDKKLCPKGVAAVVRSSAESASSFLKSSGDILHEQEMHPLQPAWVCCDDCQKWRCIPSVLADRIDGSGCRWTCKDNADKAFADCTIPQEKTNSEINAELELSDASCDENSSAVHHKTAGINSLESESIDGSLSASYTHIKSNAYLHRSRKTQTIDESMVCECKPPQDGTAGCQDGCLNRMLSIECNKRTCPCGDLCSNQQFQKRKYAKMKFFPSGEKGLGLKLMRDVSEGQFLIEYVGEVLDVASFERRLGHYASRGQRHFYFMALNGGEVIDACFKGNLGRYMNHSCKPNCRTEKWIVNGEVCIGMFALRKIKKGEELTFDYNYVRVSGAAAQKCFCGSTQCRGYIGGDSLGTEMIVRFDADRENCESADVTESAKEDLDVHVSTTVAGAVRNICTPSEEKAASPAICHLNSPGESCPEETKELMHDEPEERDFCYEDLSLQEEEDIMRTPVHVSTDSRIVHTPVHETKLSENSMSSAISISSENAYVQPETAELPTSLNPLNESIPQNCLNESTYFRGKTLKRNRKMPLPPHDLEQKSECRNNPKTSLSAITAQCNIDSGTTRYKKNAAKVTLHERDKKVPLHAATERFEKVEMALNNLLDPDGGISKRRDAAQGYLRLLVMTVTGENAGGPSNSARNLSIMLDALLKTKSSSVLTDIMRKNGLQVLHKILKQERDNFQRTPIVRKLLKVLEFLAVEKILTVELICKGPPCPGMESFKDSILLLGSHGDAQIQQIARNFRNKWIPWSLRKVVTCDRMGSPRDSRQFSARVMETSSVNCQTNQKMRDSASNLAASSMSRSAFTRTASHGPSSDPHTDPSSAPQRKRKSRWDQPADHLGHLQSVMPSGENSFLNGTQSVPQNEATSNTSDEERAKKSCRYGKQNSSEAIVDNTDEAPPGFGSSDKGASNGKSSYPGVVKGSLQETYIHHMDVSYGIPVRYMEILGAMEVGSGGQNHCNWKIAPSMPFVPFPPLPPYPREIAASTPSKSSDSKANFGVQKTQVAQDNNDSHGYKTERSSGRPPLRISRPWNYNERADRRRNPWPPERKADNFRGRDAIFHNRNTRRSTHG